MNYKCVVANKDLIIKKWDEEIRKHNNSKTWIDFKEKSLRNLDTRIVYMGILNDEIITDANYKLSKAKLDKEIILKKGKKGFCKIVIK